MVEVSVVIETRRASRKDTRARACERATMAAAVRESKAFPPWAYAKGTFVRVWARNLDEREAQ